MVERAIVAISLVGCLWLFSTAGIWGPVVDTMECTAVPKMTKKIVL